jgi:hypothetical protein
MPRMEEDGLHGFRPLRDRNCFDAQLLLYLSYRHHSIEL